MTNITSGVELHILVGKFVLSLTFQHLVKVYMLTAQILQENYCNGYSVWEILLF